MKPLLIITDADVPCVVREARGQQDEKDGEQSRDHFRGGLAVAFVELAFGFLVVELKEQSVSGDHLFVLEDVNVSRQNLIIG